MIYKAIVAFDERNGIGKNGTIPWHFSSDLKYFAEKTKGRGNNIIIMGRKTYNSIGRPLPGRINIVISKSQPEGERANGVFWFPSPERADIFCQLKNMDKNIDEVWIIGGASIYNYYLQKTALVKEIYVTNICGNYNCDVKFDPKNFRNFNASRVLKMERDGDSDLIYLDYLRN